MLRAIRVAELADGGQTYGGHAYHDYLDTAGKNAINDNSITSILQYRSFRMLFTGDTGVAAERRFLDEGADLRADVWLWVRYDLRAF